MAQTNSLLLNDKKNQKKYLLMYKILILLQGIWILRQKILISIPLSDLMVASL